MKSQRTSVKENREVSSSVTPISRARNHMGRVGAVVSDTQAENIFIITGNLLEAHCRVSVYHVGSGSVDESHSLGTCHHTEEGSLRSSQGAGGVSAGSVIRVSAVLGSPRMGLGALSGPPAPQFSRLLLPSSSQPSGEKVTVTEGQPGDTLPPFIKLDHQECTFLKGLSVASSTESPWIDHTVMFIPWVC